MLAFKCDLDTNYWPSFPSNQNPTLLIVYPHHEIRSNIIQKRSVPHRFHFSLNTDVIVIVDLSFSNIMILFLEKIAGSLPCVSSLKNSVRLVEGVEEREFYVKGGKESDGTGFDDACFAWDGASK